MDAAPSDAEHYSPEEVRERLCDISDADIARLDGISRRLAKHGLSSDDLLQETFKRVLETEKPRRWPRDLELPRFFFGVMRSIVSIHCKRLATQGKSREQELQLAEERLAKDTSFEIELVEQCEADHIRATVLGLFDRDTEAKDVIEGIMAGWTGQELCELCDVSKEQLATIKRRVNRRINKAFPDGWVSNVK